MSWGKRWEDDTEGWCSKMVPRALYKEYPQVGIAGPVECLLRFFASGGSSASPPRIPFYMSQAHTAPGKKCRLAELVQYTCNIDTIDEGVPRLHCYPILRIFRM